MPVYTTYISGSGTSGSLPNTPIHGRIIGAQITGSLHVKGSSSITGSVDATAGGRFGTGINISAGGIFSVGSNEWTGNTNATGNIEVSGLLSSSGGLITSGTVYHGDPLGAVLKLRRDDDTITANELIGAIDFYGQDSNGPGAGARIAASASAAFANGDRRETDLKFFTQDNTNNFDSMQIPRLQISGSDGTVGIDKGLKVSGYAGMKVLQVGGDWLTDTHSDLHAGYPFRVQDTLGGDVGIQIDSDSNKVGSLIFTNNDPGDGGGTGLYVDWAASNPDRVSIRRSTDLQENGAIVVHDTMGTVRVGGGAGAGDTADLVCLLVTSSLKTKPSILRLRTKHGSQSSQAYPVISWMHEAANSNNTGHWAMGIDPSSTKDGDPDGEYLRICATGPNSSAMTSGLVAMTFREGGTNAHVGVGGDSTYAMIPTGTLHVENQTTADYVLSKDLHSAQLILGNSANNTGNRSAGVYFNVSTSDDPEFHSGHIANVNTSGTAAGHQSQLSFAVNDGSGLKDSVRQRLRIDSQGAVLIVSGTKTGAGGGFPQNDVQDWEVHNNDIPSGSLTVTSLNNGGAAGDNLDPATISLVSWPGNTGKGNVVAGYDMGRIQWWSADSNFGAGEEHRTVGGYIQGTAAGVHNDTNNSPMAMEFFVRNTGGALPDLAMTIKQTGEVEFQKSIMTLGSSLEAVGAEEGAARLLLQADLSTDAGDDWEISANNAQTLTIGNDKASAGSYVSHLTITPNATITASEVAVHGELKVESGKITLDGTGTIRDASGHTRFYFLDGGASIIGGPTGATSLTCSDTAVTVAGDLFTSGYARLDALRVGTTSTDPGDGNLYVEGEVLTDAIAYTDGDDAIKIHDTGLLSFPAGVKGSPAVNTNTSNSGTAGWWIKFAESPTNAVSQDTTSAAFLIECQGGEYNAARSQNTMMIVSVKYTYKSSSPYYFGDPAPKFIVDLITDEDSGNWDPADYISLEINQDGSSSLWFRQSSEWNSLFVTHLGGGPDTYMAGTNANLTDVSWVLSTGQQWSANKTDGDGATIIGAWPKKKFNDITVVSGSIHGTGDITMKPVGGDVWIHDGSNNRFRFDAGSVAFHMIDDSNASDYFKIGVGNSGVTTFTTVDSGGAAANMVFSPDGEIIHDAATIKFQNSSINHYTFHVDSTPQIDFYGHARFNLTDSSNKLFYFGYDYDDIHGGGANTYGYWSHTKLDTTGDVDVNDDVFIRGMGTISGTTYYIKINDSSKILQYTTSTRKVKNTIQESSIGLSEIMQLIPSQFKRNGDGDTGHLGFIAEEAAEASPYFVMWGPDYEYDGDGNRIREENLTYDNGGPEVETGYRKEVLETDEIVPNDVEPIAMIAALVNAVKELKQENDALTARITALENS